MYVTNFVNKIDKKMYLEGSISPIKKPQVVILQNQNPKRSVCNWVKSHRGKEKKNINVLIDLV